MKTKKADILFFLGLLIPSVVVFSSLLNVDSLAWGDAPHFYSEELKRFLSEPSAWISRGENLGGVDPRLWIAPLLTLFGLLGKLGLGSGLITLLVFYLPAIVLSFVGPILLTRYLGFSKTVRFFAGLFYVFNTYFLLLIDGGQVGVALAYGIFPLSVLTTLKLFSKPSVSKYFTSLLVLFVLTIADPRAAAISLIFSVFWALLDKFKSWKNVLKQTVFLATALLGLGAYWILPLIGIQQESISLTVSGLGLLSFLNGLFLYQPHWPGNVFGQIVWPEWYFVGIPLLFLLGLAISNSKKIARYFLLFLFFTFLLKGNTSPLGEFYESLVNNLPFGSAFRDSSKFFIPLTLLGGLMIGVATDRIATLKSSLFGFSGNRIKYVLPALVYLYLLFLILPALTGKMNFVLSGREQSNDYNVIREEISKQEGFFRTAWFPERHPLTFETEDKPALDAKYLADLRPLADLTAGSSDKFNYLYQSEEFLDWYRLLGIRYLIFSGDTRDPNPSDEEIEAWDRLLNRIDEVGSLQKVDWDIDMPVYEIKGVNSRVFAAESAIFVIGPSLHTTYHTPRVIEVYFEDGKFDPRILQGMDSEAATLVFNGTDQDDLTMSFLHDYFVGVSDVSESEWGTFSESEYLEAKYQLLIRDIVSRNFDYGLGVALSENAGESISFDVDAEEDADYVLAIRSVGSGDSKISYGLNGDSGEIIHTCADSGEISNEGVCRASFTWFTKGIALEKGKHDLVLENADGISVVNSIALVPANEWNEAKNLTDMFVAHFGVTAVDDLAKTVLTRSSHNVDFQKRSPFWYDLEVPDGAHWVFFTDSYHPGWRLKRGLDYHSSIPAYSMVNAFYVDPDWNDVSVQFVGQRQVRWGIYIAALSMLGLAIVFLWFYPGKNE